MRGYVMAAAALLALAPAQGSANVLLLVAGGGGGGGGATYVYEVTAPESSTWAMMLIGFAGLGYAGRRASRKTARAIQRA